MTGIINKLFKSKNEDKYVKTIVYKYVCCRSEIVCFRSSPESGLLYVSDLGLDQ